MLPADGFLWFKWFNIHLYTYRFTSRELPPSPRIQPIISCLCPHATFHVFRVHFWWTEIFQLLPPITALFVFIASVARTPVLQSTSSVRRDHGGTVGPEARTTWSAVADTTFLQFDRLNLVISGYSKNCHTLRDIICFLKKWTG